MDGSLEPLDVQTRGGFMGPPPSGLRPARVHYPPYPSGQTPNPYQDYGNSGGRTANPYTSGRTPAWTSDSSRTPNPYTTGKTPAWNTSAQTPNPHADGKTPAWVTSSRTPNPYANNGGATPRGAGWGGATPAPGSSSTSTQQWGGATPARPSQWGNQSPSSTDWTTSNWVSTQVDAALRRNIQFLQ